MIYINPESRRLRSNAARTILWLKADGICEDCGKELGEDWHTDHFIPWCKGGKTVWSNLRAICKSCNLKKGKKIMERNSLDYEKMTHFSQDFPKANGVRTCQIGGYNCVIQRLVMEGKTSCSMFLPTGTGKSDLVREISIGLVDKRKQFAGVWVFSPSTDLRKQVYYDDVEDCFERINYEPPTNRNPFMEIDDLKSKRFRNGTLMESYTVQFLTANNTVSSNVDLFITHALLIQKQTGKLPVAIFDESHLYSTDNKWGGCATKMQENGIPIILITGTPFRSDMLRIPGFRTKPLENFERRFMKTKKTNDPLVWKINKGNKQVCRFELEADYEYTYQRAWEDGVILKPEPRFIDATLIVYDEILSKMPISQSGRFLRRFLMDDRTIKFSVADCIQHLRIKKVADNDCAAIVATLSDEDEFGQIIECDDNDEIADIHAHKIKREFERQAPELKVLVVTSNQNKLSSFKEKDYDILIVKVMGMIGFNCPKIKTVLNLTNYRTLPAFIQFINRGCRLFGAIAKFDVIMPKDKGMVQLWNQFESETRLIVEESVVINEEEEKEVTIEEKEKSEIEITFDKHVFSVSPINDRDKNDEILEVFDKKLPELANKMSNQEKLSHYEHMAIVWGLDWLEKLEDFVFNSTRLLDTNEEESRLRQEANDMVKEITNEILSLKKQKYDPKNPSLYADIKKRTWTCLKRCCGLPPNQKLSGLAGIDNYQNLVKKGKQVRDCLLKYSENEDFDYETFLNRKNF